MNETEIETLFNTYDTEKKKNILRCKKIVQFEENEFIKTVQKAFVEILSILARLYCFRMIIERIELLRGYYNETDLAEEVSDLLLRWSEINGRVKNLNKMLPNMYETIYISNKRGWIDASTVVVDNPQSNVYLKVSSVVYDATLNTTNVVFTDTIRHITLIRDTAYDYIDYDDMTRIIFPLNMVYMIDDEIYIRYQASFFYRELERAHVGKKYNNIEKLIGDEWVELFDREVSSVNIREAYYETEKIKGELEEICHFFDVN